MPMIYMIQMAFTNYDEEHQPPGNLFHWVGLDNFKSLLASTDNLSVTFWPILGWTLIWGFTTSALPFLTNGTWAKVTVIIVNMWIGITVTMLMVSGILITVAVIILGMTIYHHVMLSREKATIEAFDVGTLYDVDGKQINMYIMGNAEADVTYCLPAGA